MWQQMNCMLPINFVCATQMLGFSWGLLGVHEFAPPALPSGATKPIQVQMPSMGLQPLPYVHRSVVQTAKGLFHDLSRIVNFICALNVIDQSPMGRLKIASYRIRLALILRGGWILRKNSVDALLACLITQVLTLINVWNARQKCHLNQQIQLTQHGCEVISILPVNPSDVCTHAKFRLYKIYPCNVMDFVGSFSSKAACVCYENLVFVLLFRIS